MTTVTDPIQLKLDHLFDISDTDGDGYVEWNDYRRFIDRYLDTFKIDKNDRKAQALTVAYQMYWVELLRHAGVDKRLSKEQFHQANRAVSVDTSRFNLLEGVPNAIFDIMDTDGDDIISKAEFKQRLDLWGISDPVALDNFSKLDTDHDGGITRQEFVQAVRDFYYSPELDSPGSRFFGSV